MRRRNKREYRFVSVVCFVLAIVFMTSSLLKSINIHSFSMEVEEYIGLYLLKDVTKENEQRIFTYEDDKQVWW